MYAGNLNSFDFKKEAIVSNAFSQQHTFRYKPRKLKRQLYRGPIQLQLYQLSFAVSGIVVNRYSQDRD